MSSIPKAKKILRAAISQYIGNLSMAARTAADTVISRTIMALPELKEADTVMAYAPLPDEINIWPLLENLLAHDKQLILPRVDSTARKLHLHIVTDLEKDLTETGYAGIREPSPQLPQVTPKEIDMVLVPGRAFDDSGRRLGRGGGYYDRFLAATGAALVGLGYEGQLMAEVPTDDHDLPVQIIVTPERIIRP